MSSPCIPLQRGNRSPINFQVKIVFQFTPLSVVYSAQKIENFLYSPFGGGVRGRIFRILIFKHIKKASSGGYRMVEQRYHAVAATCPR